MTSDEKYTQVTYSPSTTVTWMTPTGEQVDVTMEVCRLRRIEALYLDLEKVIGARESDIRQLEFQIVRLRDDLRVTNIGAWVATALFIISMLLWIFAR